MYTDQLASSELAEHQSKPMLLNEAILSRHSTRFFLPTPVPEHLLYQALELARQSPSNSNTQAWQLCVVTGTALQRLKSALSKIARQTAPDLIPLPEQFRHFRSELGKKVYGEGMGIPRDATEARDQAVLQNYEFFGAPVGIIVCISKTLPGVAAMSVGIYVQTLLLALTSLGLGTCVQVTIAGYKDVVREQIGIAEDLDILCGISVGYENKNVKVNMVRTSRLRIDETTKFVSM